MPKNKVKKVFKEEKQEQWRKWTAKDVDEEEPDLWSDSQPWKRGVHTDHTSPEPKSDGKKDTTTETSTICLCTPSGRRGYIAVVSWSLLRP